MRNFMAAYKIELSKLIAKKKYIVFLIIAVLICVCNMSSQFIISIISDNELSISLNNFPLMMLPFFAEIFIPLISFMAVTDSIGAEFGDCTIKAMLLRPVNRFKLFTAKILASFTVSAILFMAVLFTATILDFFVNGADGFKKYFLFNVGSYIVDLIPMIIIVIMGALINLLAKGTTLSMFLCILIYAILKYCSYFIGITDGILFTSYLQWHKLWIGNALPFNALISKITLLLGYASVMFCGGYYLFDKKDV